MAVLLEREMNMNLPMRRIEEKRGKVDTNKYQE